uniref:Uncharacterized protein LOC100183578 n=1 Tax=Phallusia mammillata TaxID=59560 RepID=A0A6F9DIM9_9ASCI|nr:uncharacterized protein LOC100183578 [Phallusia mammillata]
MTSSALMGPPPMKATYVSTTFDQSGSSVTSDTLSTVSEPIDQVGRFFRRTNDNFYRHSLKEKVLLRKFDNNRRSFTRWRTSDAPLGGSTDLFNNSNSIRKKLSENRQQLNDLLSRVPFPVVRSQSFNKEQPQETKDAPKSPIHDELEKHVTDRIPIPSESSRTLHRSLHSDDSSSSDEDLREPIAESPPNLSDEDCFPPTREFKRALPPTSYSSQTSKKCIVSIARTSSRANMLTHRKGSNSSPPNPLYEAAKPKPPPRAINQKTSEQATLNRSDEVTTVATTDEQQEIITLPYVSRSNKGNWRSSDISRLRHGSRSHNASESNDVESEDKPTALISQSKTDTSPSRRTHSSSGYSSPGSNAGSSSLSPSSSSASSTSSHSLALPKSRLEHANSDVSGRSNATAVSASEINGTALEEKKKEGSDDFESVTSSMQVDEDVFPVAKWTQSSEYSDLSKEKPKETVHESDVTTSKVPEVSTAKDSRLGKIDEVVQRKSQTLKSRNMISMVEPRAQTLDYRHMSKSSNTSVKMRIPGSGKSKKANAASRNSLAFAKQASSALEDVQESTKQRTKSFEQPSEFEKDVRRAASLSPKSFALTPQTAYITESELSASLANLDKVGLGGPVSAPASFGQRNFNTVSGATGRRLTEKSHFFDDESSMNVNNNNSGHYSSTRSVYTDSTWSLNPASDPAIQSQPSRKPSLRNRLKGAFSFQNIRRAISTDKLNEEENFNQRSVSHCYLNENNEDISRMPSQKPRKKSPSETGEVGNLHKAPSISSIFSTVRMRKRKSRERRARQRNTIAVVKSSEDYEINERERPKSLHAMSHSRTENVGTPGHFRPIGKVLQMDTRQGTLLIEMVKPPSGPYGFYLARRRESGDRGSVFISSLSDSYPDKMYAGLMKLGDEITEVNGKSVHNLALSQVYDIILDSDRILLRIKPSQVHAV